jgi:hypothetical protein
VRETLQMLVVGADDIEGHLPLRYRHYRDTRGGRN